MTSHVYQSIVGGEDVPSTTYLSVDNPFVPQPKTKPTQLSDEDVAAMSVGIVAVAGPEVVEAALRCAAEAEFIGAQLPTSERSQILIRLMELVAREYDELAWLICAEAGKPIDLARAEVERTMATIQATIDALGNLVSAIDIGTVAAGAGRTGLIRRVPRGVTTAITPFNFPLNLVMHKLAPAIAAGCPIILKPSPQAPLCAFRLTRLALQAGLPAPMISCIMPEVRDMAPLISDPRVKVVSFTGSAEVGWRIKAEATRQHVILELGGNAAAIVCADADLAAAAQAIARGAFAYAGQSCISVQRVFVDLDRLDSFLDHLSDATAGIGCGDPTRPGVVCGPVISASAADRIEAWLERFAASDGTVIRRSTREGNVLTPAIVQFFLGSDEPLICEEVFGPVVAVSGYDGIAEAIECVNNSRFGLQAGIFTDDLPTLQFAFKHLEVGAIIHNDAPTYRIDHMPYGGVKDSGVGLEGPRYALEELTVPRMLVLKI